MKKLGLGIQQFAKFKQDNLVYVDKTELIYKLVDDGSYYFFSRPRRFGKSLLVDTLRELFLGNKPLFEGTWIYDRWEWQKQYPVIKLSFAEMGYREYGLEKALELYLLKLAEEHDIQFETTTYGQQFLELIEILGQETPVAVLIDEYDKPIIDYLEQAEFNQALKNREILKTLYMGVKDQGAYLRFFFMTGVSKFSKVSIFSDLNHLTDITLTKHFSTLLGYTETELINYYGFYLTELADVLGLSESEMMQMLKQWYNGYSWDGTNFVYNPYSILSLLHSQQFKNYWFETGTPTFLIKKWKETGHKANQAINKLVKESAFNKYDVDNLNITAIMFQTGYLTIKEMTFQDALWYRLDFPNKEVRDSFLDFAVEHYANSSTDEMSYMVENLLEALTQKDMQLFVSTFQALFSSITVKQLDKVKEYEGFYHSIIYIVLKLLGIHVTCEVQSNYGTTDAVIQTDAYIYVIEFKLGTAQSAIDQIKKKQYYTPYLADKRAVIIVGIGLDKTKRNLDGFLVETVDQ